MKVINYSRNDYANFAFDNAMALQSVGVDCKSYVDNKHLYDYTHTSEKITRESIMKEMYKADFVQIFHSDIEALKIFIHSNSRAKLIIYHAGSVYRRNPNLMNSLFNGYAHKIICALPEFMGLCGKNEQYIVGAIDTDRITPNKRELKQPYIFAHYPSNYNKKGSYEICKMMDEVKIELKFSSTNVPMEQQYSRAMDCDVYIELFKPVLEGKPYGSFGIQALESASMGKIVVTQNLNPDVYFNEYGFCRLLTPARENDFKEMIELLANSTAKEISNLQEETRQWVVDNHSYRATGERLLNKVLNGL